MGGEAVAVCHWALLSCSLLFFFLFPLDSLRKKLCRVYISSKYPWKRKEEKRRTENKAGPLLPFCHRGAWWKFWPCLEQLVDLRVIWVSNPTAYSTAELLKPATTAVLPWRSPNYNGGGGGESCVVVTNLVFRRRGWRVVVVKKWNTGINMILWLIDTNLPSAYSIFGLSNAYSDLSVASLQVVA